jgi:hypothetical protein
LAAEPLVPLLESALPSVLKLALDRRRISLKNEGAIVHLRTCVRVSNGVGSGSFKPGLTEIGRLGRPSSSLNNTKYPSRVLICDYSPIRQERRRKSFKSEFESSKALPAW